MAAYRTELDLVTAALRHRNVIAGDAEAAGFERSNAVELWRGLCAEMQSDGIVEFADDQIPLDAFRSCWMLLADALAPSYGQAPTVNPDDPQHPSRQALRRRIAVVTPEVVMEIHGF